jgi:hypothetical protein
MNSAVPQDTITALRRRVRRAWLPLIFCPVLACGAVMLLGAHVPQFASQTSKWSFVVNGVFCCAATLWFPMAEKHILARLKAGVSQLPPTERSAALAPLQAALNPVTRRIALALGEGLDQVNWEVTPSGALPSRSDEVSPS